MAIDDKDTRVQYVATAGQVNFTFPFDIFEDIDLAVFLTRAGVAPDPSLDKIDLNTDYTVTLNGAPPSDGFIDIIGPVLPIGAGDIITIQRDIPIDRTTDFAVAGEFAASEINTQLDKIVAQVQQVEALIVDLGVRYAVTDQITPFDNLLPLLKDGEVWIKNSAGRIVGADINGGDVNTLRSELASETMAAPGSGIVGHYDTLTGSTTVEAQLNATQTDVTAIAIQVGTNTTDIATNTDAIERKAQKITGVADGLQTRNEPNDVDHDIEFFAGTVGSSNSDRYLRLVSPLIKKIDAAWVLGTNQGGLFSGTVAANTSYHFFIIRDPNTEVVDAGFDTSPMAANRPVAYTEYARVWSLTTDASSNWIRYEQRGDDCLLHVPQQIFIGNPPSSPVTHAAKCPTGVEFKNTVHVVYRSTSGSHEGLIQSPDIPNIPLASGGAMFFSGAGEETIGNFEVYSDVAGNIVANNNAVAPGTLDLELFLRSWTDRRGRA